MRHSETVSKPFVRRDELHESLTFSAIFEPLGTRVTRPSGVLRQSDSVRAATGNRASERRARSDAPYLQQKQENKLRKTVLSKKICVDLCPSVVSVLLLKFNCRFWFHFTQAASA